MAYRRVALTTVWRTLACQVFPTNSAFLRPALQTYQRSTHRCMATTPVVGFTNLKEKMAAAKDFVALEDTDYLELYVSNAMQAAHWFHSVVGFQPVAYMGLETGETSKTSYVLQQGSVRLVVTASLDGEGEIVEFVKRHGDGVKAVGLRVPDARKAFEEAVGRGAKPFLAPREVSDENGAAVLSGIHVVGSTVHIFVQRKEYKGAFLPGYRPWTRPVFSSPEVGIRRLDHMVLNVDWGEMNKMGKFFEDVYGMSTLVTFDDKDVSTDYTALQSKVMTNSSGSVKIPINEPAKGLKKSQIEEFLIFNQGPGYQHLALMTDDILKTVGAMSQRGCEFLTIPDEYYATVHQRCGHIDEAIRSLAELGILVDRDENGYLLQIFTRPITDRPTIFLEIIQRKGALSFGKGNFLALFKSIEEEQRQRGTL